MEGQPEKRIYTEEVAAEARRHEATINEALGGKRPNVNAIDWLVSSKAGGSKGVAVGRIMNEAGVKAFFVADAIVEDGAFAGLAPGTAPLAFTEEEWIAFALGVGAGDFRFEGTQTGVDEQGNLTLPSDPLHQAMGGTALLAPEAT